MGIFAAVGEEFRDKFIVFVKLDAVAVGEGINIAYHAVAMLSRHHRR